MKMQTASSVQSHVLDGPQVDLVYVEEAPERIICGELTRATASRR